MVDIAGPGRHDRRPERLDHRPVGRRRHHRRRQRRLRHPAHPVASSTASPPATSSAPTPTPVTVTGDGVHELEVRITDDLGRVNDWHTHQVKIDTVNPIDNTTVAAGWLPLDLPRRARARHRRSTRRSRASSGGSTAATSSAPPRTTTRSASRATASTRSRPASSTTPATAAPGRRTRSGSTRRCRPTPPRPLPRGWRNTPYSVVLNGSDARLRRGLRALARSSSRASRGRRARRHAATSTRAEIDRRRHAHARAPASATSPATTPAWRAETDPHRPRRCRPTTRSIRRRRSATATSSPSTRRTTARASPAIEWQARRRRRSRPPPTATITGAGAHTLKSRVQDNAGNWSDWAAPLDHASTSASTPTAPTDTTVDPDDVALVAYTVTVTPTDDIDGTGVDYVEWRYGNQPAGQGPSGSQFTISADGEHEIETRATDNAGNATPLAPPDAADRHDAAGRHDRLAGGWTNANTLTLQRDRRDVRASPTSSTRSTTAAPDRRRQRHRRHAAGDGTYTIAPPRHSTTPASHGLEDRRRSRSTPSLPVNTSAAAPTAWQTSDALAGADRHRRRLRRRPRRVARRTTATVQTRHARRGRHRGHADARDARSSTRPATPRPGARRPSASTAPSRSTRRPRSTAAWRKTNFTTTVTGTDASPGSGVARVEYKVDGGRVVTTPAVSITTEGPHKLETRVVDIAGNASDWRADTVGIDKIVPTLAVDCGAATWRNTPATCTVTRRRRRRPGLPTLTAARGAGAAERRSAATTPSRPTAPATVTFRAVDGAGNEATATADVKIDRTPPAAARHLRRRTPARAGPARPRAPTRSPADRPALLGRRRRRGRDRRRRRVHRRQGQGRRLRDRRRRQHRRLEPGHARRPHAAADADEPHEPDADEPTPRTTTEAVLLRKGGRRPPRACSASSRCRPRRPRRPSTCARSRSARARSSSWSRSPTGKKSKTFTKTQTTKKGYSTRISVQRRRRRHGHGRR